MAKKYDILTFGRTSIDLYSNQLGAPFEEIKDLSAYVGGSSTNIAVSSGRLGLRTALLTAVGDDQVGKFILRFLEDEGIETKFIPIMPGRRSPAVILGVEPPDRFPLVFYRDNAPDLQIGIDHVLNTHLEDFRAVVLSGNALSSEPSKSSTFFAAEKAGALGLDVFLDLDFRADQWYDPRAFGVMVRALLRNVDTAIGTEEEVLAASFADEASLAVKHQQVSAPEIEGDIHVAIERLLECGIRTLIVKRGAKGASIFQKNKAEVVVPGFPVEVLNLLGAGDAFAGGFLYGCMQGWDHYKSVRMGNACGAILVTKHGCANFMPDLQTVYDFTKGYGGL